jgi:hypothetical protein
MKFLKNLFKQTKVPDDKICHLKIDIDNKGNFWVDWGWENSDSLIIFSGLLFKLNNGLMLDDILETIKQQCIDKDNEDAYLMIIDTLSGLYDMASQEEQKEVNEMTKKLSSPLVKPTQVINHD